METRNTVCGVKIEVVINGKTRGGCVTGFDLDADTLFTLAHDKLDIMRQDFDSKTTKA